MGREDASRRRKRSAAAEGEASSAAKKKAKETPPPLPNRGGKGAAAGDAEKREGDKKGVEAKTCVVCPDKPARDHLKAEEHRVDSVFWCEECWAEFEKGDRGGWKEKAASSQQGAPGRRLRKAGEWTTEISKMARYERLVVCDEVTTAQGFGGFGET